MSWCPRCGQGWVVRCRVKGASDFIQVCQECDTVWIEDEPTGEPPFLILEDFLARYGLAPLWSNLEVCE